MKLLNVDTLAEARSKLLDAADCLPEGIEWIGFEESAGRVLAEDLTASESVPGFDKSTVDGYAVHAGDTAGAGDSIPAILELAGEVAMGGAAPGSLRPGQCMAVPTGGMIPEGADAMVMAEYTEPFGERRIAVYDSVSPGRNIIRTGEDVRKGEKILPKNTRIRPQEISLLASMGATRIPVRQAWRVILLSTGDELVPASDMPAPGQIRDSNSYGLAALCKATGMQIVRQLVLPDDEDMLRAAVEAAKTECDILLISGGSSKGHKDYTARVLDTSGAPGVFTHGIAIKPGKPTILGYSQDSGTVFFGLPGHPVAALLIYELLVDWLWRIKNGIPTKLPLPARLAENLPGGDGRTLCQLVSLVSGEHGLTALPVLGNSGLLATLTRADGYILLDDSREGLSAGSPVDVYTI